MSKKVIAREAKFAVHIPTRHPDQPDVHMVKEVIYYDDSTSEPNIRWLKDFKRKFWVTKPNKRNHQQKKELESLDNLLEKEVTQSELRNEVAKLLDKTWSNDNLKQLSMSPYLYGTDITSTSLIKHLYMTKYPNYISAYSIATFDIETDVINGTEDIIMATVAFKDKLYTAVVSDFIKGFSLPKEAILKTVNKYIQEYIDKHNMSTNIEIYIAKDTIDLISNCFNTIHKWMPDFLAIWNMDFDIPKVLSQLEKYSVDPRDIFCDPSVPYQYRICRYKQGIKKKVTASGKVQPINPASQWHTLICTSSYYTIDAMCSYKQIRMGGQEETSYSLDAILEKELGIRKLKFEEANDYKGLSWHQFMQTNYKLEYIVYNMFDCISMLELDMKTKDLAYTLPSYAATTDFELFRSQPRRIADSLHFFALEKGYVLAATGRAPTSVVLDDEESEDDEDILSLSGWIITLPAHMSVLGMNCIQEDPITRTGIRCFVYDSDVVSAYPSCTSIENVSRGTTKRELISIEGIDEEVFRMQNINLVLGRTNSIEYSTKMFNLPKPHELLEDFI